MLTCILAPIRKGLLINSSFYEVFRRMTGQRRQAWRRRSWQTLRPQLCQYKSQAVPRHRLGSGFESPGWREAQRVSQGLGHAFDELLIEHQVDLVALYCGSPDVSLYRLAEAMIEWDERVALWRVRHYKIATRIIGHQVVGTKAGRLDFGSRQPDKS